jgi:putative transposase
MSNHVHLIVVPHRPDSLARALQHAHGGYAAYRNARAAASGHVWQGRYYSCPLDAPHLWAALRYCELNPVRAGLVTEPEEYRWSSATAHCGAPGRTFSIAGRGTAAGRRRAGASICAGRIGRLKPRRSAPALTPAAGDGGFCPSSEKKLLRRLAPQKGGRPPALSADGRQESIAFEA